MTTKICCQACRKRAAPIKICKNGSSLTADMHYDGDGFFTSIICTYRSGKNIWSDFKNILNELAEG